MNNILHTAPKKGRLCIVASLLTSLLVTPQLLAASGWIKSSVNNQSKLLSNPSPFPDKSLKNWKEKTFVGNTRYSLVSEDGATVLKAQANQTASVLYKRKTINIKKTPWLEWSWKIDSTYAGINEKSKQGDDFPARLYVTAQVGFMPWDTVAINYVWSSQEPLNSVWSNPYTDKSIMVAVQSGQTNVQQWVAQRRNINTDFKQFFNIDVNKITGYAVMVDGDNASQNGTAYFGNIEFLAK